MSRSITGLDSVENEFGFEGLALYSFEGAGDSTFKGQKDEGRDHRGGVAQLGEHLLCKQGVIGSNPFISTNFFSWEKEAQPTSLCFQRRKRPGYEAKWAHSSAG